MPRCNPASWFWLGQPAGHAAPVVYSSAARALVPETDAGYQEFVAAGGRATPWPRDEAGDVTIAALDETLALAGQPRTGLAPLAGAELKSAVDGECKRRILAVASAEAQTNILGYVATGTLTADDRAAFLDSVAWVAAMRAAAQALIGAGDQTFAADAHWPACPADAAALAARF